MDRLFFFVCVQWNLCFFFCTLIRRKKSLREIENSRVILFRRRKMTIYKMNEVQQVLFILGFCLSVKSEPACKTVTLGISWV